MASGRLADDYGSHPAGVTDPVVWMQLVQLSFQLARTYVIGPKVWDPGTDDPPLEYPSARLN
jgi:hypothetical protein